ncbi:hypothetical protein ULMS_01210 [Patiriisocius marinistellae]|uniref:Uncharacterized protein n=1 Tax=Patiriisocius marinistellae TaxID=2494560 RepID=A0A5J4FT30_9FLAO|nr:hypothetical protein [Patiriisocius marinistellae]GEQ84613.1 hypothetical protein ULMS_01210 [Patiriisocius marinistellae]
MKKQVIFLFALISILLFTETLIAQDITQYDFLEVIVVQKANNRGKVKRIRVEEQESIKGKNITVDAIEDLETTAQLLNYMNRANWEFLDRQAIVSDDNDPVWMSYIFKKAK